MRLNCALVSSFLFVPIVLADYHLEKHQPQFLNRKNINDASVDRVPWAGASLPGSNEACLFRTGGYTAATGTFNAPLAWGSNFSTGVVITVGIGSLCGVGFMAGIKVMLIDNVVSYAGLAQWDAQVEWSSNFAINTGDFIRASVNVHSATTGTALLENLSNGQSWVEYFGVQIPAVCQQSAEWIVEALPNYPTNVAPVPKFSTVTFVNATVETAKGASATWLSGGANVINIEYNNTMLTTGMAEENIVVVAYEMM